MAPTIDTAIETFHKELAAAERSTFESRIEWGVREAHLERRLMALHQRASGLRKPIAPSSARPAPGRDAVSLYATRWCHVARRSLILAK